MTDDYLNKLCELREDVFTKEILKPLFEAMGYDRVDFNGGAYEKGRDLIAQRRIPPKREMYVVYVQSKKIGLSQSSADSAKFTQLAHQLRQCCTTPIIDSEGRELKPSLVYIACPEKIKNRFLDEVMKQLVGMPVDVHPYDGVQIISDIREYKPELLEKLKTMESKLSSSTVCLDRNEELLSALKSENQAGFQDYYSDLNFFVGSFDSNLLLHLDVGFSRDCIYVPEENWQGLKDEVSYFHETHGVFIPMKEVSEIEGVFNRENQAYESVENQEVKRDIQRVSSVLEDVSISVEHKMKFLRSSLNEKVNPHVSRLDDDELQERRRLISMLSNLASQEGGSVRELEWGGIKKDGPSFYKEIDSVISLVERKEDLCCRLKSLKERLVEKPTYRVEVDVDLVINKINGIKKRYLEGVKRINEREVGSADLKVFLSETESALSFLSRIRRNDSLLSQVINFKSEVSAEDRVAISPHDIFSTKHDVAVYGGAGVGKTTTLKMYASKYSKYDKGVVIYVPLNSLVSKYKDCINSKKTARIVRDELLPSLVLLSGGVEIDEDNVRKAKYVMSRNATLILDGLDEVYNTINGIIPEISRFKEVSSGSQLIISSRDCVSYLKDIDFLGITLLPFTKLQLISFIRGWLGDGDKSEGLVKAIENGKLFDTIKTPLLATITCSLVEKGVNAPSTETEIYSERLRLLTGEYDIHKNIQRQKNTGEMLRKCARKIAFHMHSRGTRSMEKPSMFTALKASLGDFYSDDLLLGCLEELIDPCNVIVFEPAPGTFTLGHFRFQEYMASEEIKFNREIDISDLVTNDWWRGALCLYAQDNDFSFLFDEVYNRYGSIKKSRVTFESMIDHAPESRKRKLKSIFDNFSYSDGFDEKVLGVDDDFLNLSEFGGEY